MMESFSNALAMVPADTQPGSIMVSPKLDVMDECITLLDSILIKLVRWCLSYNLITTNLCQSKLLRRMSTVLDNMEALMFEAERLKGFQWCHEEPLWVSWPIEKFGRLRSLLSSVSDGDLQCCLCLS
jgi:hypothetical protein